MDEESGLVKIVEELTFPPPEELKNEDAWGNIHPYILKSGRIDHIPPPDMEEDQIEDWKAAQAEKEKVEDRFRSINEHEGLDGT